MRSNLPNSISILFVLARLSAFLIINIFPKNASLISQVPDFLGNDYFASGHDVSSWHGEYNNSYKLMFARHEGSEQNCGHTGYLES
jgi:hypothetical protein